MKTEIAKDIERAKGNIQYDTQCKRVLANKVILAWIMRATIDEFSDLSIEEIVACIEGKPQVNEVFVEPGLNEKVEGLNTEDKDENEGDITYDIRFVVYIPEKNSKRMVKAYIDVEAQKDFYVKYPIQSRGVYYGARMISSQNGIEFKVPYYGEIKKVYSIWVCMNAPNYIGNAISAYEFSKRDIVEGIPDRFHHYGKISVIMICLNRKVKRSKGFFDMMNTLLAPDMEVQRKKQILENEYNIAMDDGLGEELKEMGAFLDMALEYAEEVATERVTKRVTEDVTQRVTEDVTQRVTKDVTQRVTKDVTQRVTKDVTQRVTKDVTQKVTESNTKTFVENLLKENLLSDGQIIRVAQISEEKLKEIKEEMLCLV